MKQGMECLGGGIYPENMSCLQKSKPYFQSFCYKQSEENLKDSRGAVGGKWESIAQYLLRLSQLVQCH